MPFMTKCHRCTALYEANRSDSRYCTGSCRAMAASDRKVAEARADAVDLLRRQSALIRHGIATGDLDAVGPALDALVVESELLFRAI